MSLTRSSATPLIDLRSASFGYVDRLVVERATMRLDQGEVVALLGPNGSGKSTLVKGILGLIPLLGGELDLFGTTRERFHDHTRVGCVPQRHSLSTSVRATVREIVATGRIPHRPWWRPAGAIDAAKVEEALVAVGLANRAEHDVSSLSGGQQRRVLIARALAGEPDVLLMDEPTAGVDHANQVILGSVLHRLAEDGRSMLIVTHELDALREAVTRIVCMDSGHIDFDGTPEVYAVHEAGHGAGGGHHHHDEERLSGSAILGTDPFPADHGGVR